MDGEEWGWPSGPARVETERIIPWRGWFVVFLFLFLLLSIVLFSRLELEEDGTVLDW